MLVCNLCGNVIDEDELEYYYEAHGERRAEICHCGGEFVEATECACCGTWFDNEELNGVCEVCLEEATTLDTAISMGNENLVTDVAINGFYAYLLTAEKINDIIGEWVREHMTDETPEVRKYLHEDMVYFAEYLASEGE